VGVAVPTQLHWPRAEVDNFVKFSSNGLYLITNTADYSIEVRNVDTWNVINEYTAPVEFLGNAIIEISHNAS